MRIPATQWPVRWLVVGGMAMLLVATVRPQAQVEIPPRVPPANERTLPQTVEGPALFQMHCAVCHGRDGSGGGPAAAALRKRTPDLTRISQRHDGVFPFEKVQQTISGDVVPSPAHGSREMPIWGPVFSQIEWDQDLGRIRIYNLAKHLESLQKK